MGHPAACVERSHDRPSNDLHCARKCTISLGRCCRLANEQNVCGKEKRRTMTGFRCSRRLSMVYGLSCARVRGICVEMHVYVDVKYISVHRVHNHSGGYAYVRT